MLVWVVLPSGDCDQIAMLEATGCRSGRTKRSDCDLEPLRLHVWELPEIKPIVAEHQRHRLLALPAAHP